MSSIEVDDRFYDLLFEVSNDTRHKILLLLRENPERVTQIAKKLDLNSPEASRHLTRLSVSRLIQRDMDNKYHVTSFGEYILNIIGDLNFAITNRDYFVFHNPTNIPLIFQKRMSELLTYTPVNNFMKFLNFMNEKIMEAKKYVWLSIDQYPIISIGAMLNSVERNVKIQIIEQGELIGPNVAFDNKHLIAGDEESPNVEIRSLPNKDVYLFVSDAGSAVAFPSENKYDYTGFINEKTENESWSNDIFNHYWSKAKPKTALPLQKLKKVPPKTGKSIIITPKKDPALNFQAIQNAVDTYDEITLKGG